MIKKIAKNLLYKIEKASIPKNLKEKHIQLDSYQLKLVEKSVKENYLKGWLSKDKNSSEAYEKNLKAHVLGRLESDRINYIPWLNKTLKLNGPNILEIGCGTGSSTVALAEQGANVTGIDLDEASLKVAKDRCKAYNLSAEFILGNASDVYEQLKNKKFDMIIFFACMEHMIYEERIDCINKYYNLLEDGAYLSIVETPNRLWYFDHHTSLLPFYHWLPDNAAFDYAKFSERKNFKELYNNYSDENFLHFLRRGRGFSFHELEIALSMTADKFKVADFKKHIFVPNSLNQKFYKLLIKINPKINKGFFHSFINIILQK